MKFDIRNIISTCNHTIISLYFSSSPPLSSEYSIPHCLMPDSDTPKQYVPINVFSILKVNFLVSRVT